jgi:hypothetical protein
MPLPEPKKHICMTCSKVILLSGSFKPEWPEYKEVRAVGAFKKEDIKIVGLYNPKISTKSPMAYEFICRCDNCGTKNVFTMMAVKQNNLNVH